MPAVCRAYAADHRTTDSSRGSFARAVALWVLDGKSLSQGAWHEQRVQGRAMHKLLIMAILVPALVAGCGDVIVFGHKVHEGSASPEAKTDVPPPAAGAAAAAPVPAPVSPASAPPASAPPMTVAEAPAPGPAVAAASATPSPASPANAPPVSAPATGPVVAVAPASPAAPAPVIAPASMTKVVRAVNVSVTPAAAAKLTDDSTFAAGALAAAVSSELKSRKLLNAQDPRAAGTLEITIEDLNTRPSSNAVIFGYQPMAGTLSGEILVADGSGADQARFKVVAQSRWNVAVSGEEKDSLRSLYHRFAELTADRLAGVASNGESSADFTAR
jgi:hypothetical protein